MQADSKAKKWGFGGQLLLLAGVSLSLVIVGKTLVKFAGFDDDLTLRGVQFLAVIISISVLFRR